MQYQWDFSFLVTQYPLLLLGLWGTLVLTVITVAIGLVLGVVFGAARSARSKLLSFPGGCYVEFFRNVPPLVLVFWFHFTVPILINQQGSPFVSATIALSLYNGAYFAEIYRSGIQSIEREQWEGGKAIGFGYFRLMRYIVLPQAIKRMIPAFANQTIDALKLTTLASTITFAELLYYGRLIANTEFRPLEAYTTVAVLYIVISLMLSYVSVRIESWLARSD